MQTKICMYMSNLSKLTIQQIVVVAYVSVFQRPLSVKIIKNNYWIFYHSDLKTSFNTCSISFSRIFVSSSTVFRSFDAILLVLRNVQPTGTPVTTWLGFLCCHVVFNQNGGRILKLYSSIILPLGAFFFSLCRHFI